MEKIEKSIRSITKSGGSKVIAIPPSYLEDNDLEPKDKVEVRWKGDVLEIRPVETVKEDVGIENGR